MRITESNIGFQQSGSIWFYLVFNPFNRLFNSISGSFPLFPQSFQQTIEQSVNTKCIFLEIVAIIKTEIILLWRAK